VPRVAAAPQLDPPSILRAATQPNPPNPSPNPIQSRPPPKKNPGMSKDDAMKAYIAAVKAAVDKYAKPQPATA
jgi:hypothetical protein